MFTPKKIWTLEEALEVFPRIKRITEDFYEQAYTISKLLSDKLIPFLYVFSAMSNLFSLE